jgi:protein-disulfide isomerase
MNCDAVAASPYASLFAGLPLSSFAAGWFLALFVVALTARNVFWRRESLRAALVLTGVGTLLSIAYFGIMAGVLHTYCLFCLVTDAINILALLIVLSLKPEGFSEHKPEAEKWKSFAGLTAASVLIAVLGLRTLDASTLTSDQATQMADATLNSPVLSVNAGPEFPSLGPANAPITIVEFSDFQCPFCRIGAFTVNSVVEHYPQQVRVVFRNYPLDSACNRKLERSMHPYACEAAKTAVCAHQQGKFEPVYQTLFENQATFAPGRVSQLAKEAGVDPARLTGCIAASETSVAVSRDIEEGINLGVQSTPTFFINGRRIEGVMPPEVWNRIIDQLLKQQPHA